MCLGQVLVNCPKCKLKISLTRPDSLHTVWSLTKPDESEIYTDVIEQVVDCKNTGCDCKFTVYWYEEQTT